VLYPADKPNEPVAKLLIGRNGYGFGMDWSLLLEYNGDYQLLPLGQDAKVCGRLLGITPRDLNVTLTGEYGPVDLREEDTQDKLAQLLLKAIVEQYKGDGDPYEALMSAPHWQFMVS
jgi:hypothetical protein